MSKFNEVGRCGYCNSENISYGDEINEGNQIGYEITCEDCDWEGVEWHSLSFIEMTTTSEPFEAEVVMNPVNSGHIEAVGYSPELEVLYVKFKGNPAKYRYNNFPVAYFADFMAAKSKGQFYNESIKGRFSEKKSK